MALVNRLIDVFFRTLDTVDAARARLDRALGRSSEPAAWTTEWSPMPEGPSQNAMDLQSRSDRLGVGPASGAGGGLQRPPRESQGAPHFAMHLESPRASPSPSSPDAPAPPSPRKTARADSTVPMAVAKKKRSKAGSNRKGSVDRSGKDFDSPRARAIVARLRADRIGVITNDAALDGKKVLARVLWALGTADRAGSELGLTAADGSALLHLAAGVEVFATNVARTCRDEGAFIQESTPDGRSKRYRLTDAGRAAAARLDLRTLE